MKLPPRSAKYKLRTSQLRPQEARLILENATKHFIKGDMITITCETLTKELGFSEAGIERFMSGEAFESFRIHADGQEDGHVHGDVEALNFYTGLLEKIRDGKTGEPAPNPETKTGLNL